MAKRVGFYGLDVYSLWDSLREIIGWLQENVPDAVPAAERAWQCFLPHHEDPHQYAWSTRLVPQSCEADVVALLTEVRNRVFSPGGHDEDAFDAVQNAEVAANAEHYYRIMVRGDRQSWNVRDHHMADTIDRVSRHLGAASKGLIWEHNTHIGDARATDMAQDGLVNVGQLLRERHAGEGRAAGWLRLPPRRGDRRRRVGPPGAHPAGAGSAAGQPRGLPASGPRRAVGPGVRRRQVRALAFDLARAPRDRRGLPPGEGAGNYVPTRMGERYDALIWLEHTAALRPVHHEGPPREPEFETEPTGF